MTAADRYSDASILLREANQHGVEHSKRALLLMEAQVHATLAVAGATALAVTLPQVGDSEEITEWARVVQPSAMSGGLRRSDPPEFWPPQHGDIWRDGRGDHWACQADKTLARISDVPADDHADEIRKVYGPLKLHRPSPRRETECPF